MPQIDVLDIAQDLATTTGKSILSKAVDATIPDVIVNLYHKLAKSSISLTSEKEIAGFNGFIDALASFCDPNHPLNIDPDVAACWRIFTYTKVNASTYQFENPFRFAEINDLYQQRQTVKGRTYWDYPFTSSILALAACSPALKGNAKQSLVRLVFGYITSIAVVTATFETESKKYEAIKHLHRVVNALINEQACRSLFDEKNTQVLVQISHRITQFFSVKHAEREAAFIPEAVSNLKRVSREIASQLFFMILISTEANNKKTLTHDYHRLSRGFVNNDIDKPAHFSLNNPFTTMLKESSKLLNALHDEPNGADILRTLEVPDEVYIHKYLVANLVLALTHEKSWFGEPSHGLLYFFMQKVDVNTQASSWMEETDVDDQKVSVSQLCRMAYWLKFSLTIASVAKDLNLLLSMEGQRWLARGSDAQIIQQFIFKLQADLGQFKAEIGDLQNFLRGRLRANCGREHHLFKLVHKLDATTALLFEKGVQPLLNIEEKYLVMAEYMHAIRQQFFSRIITVLNQSNLGFTLPTPEPMQEQEISASFEPHHQIIFSKQPPSPDKFLQCKLTARLSNWIEDAFNSSSQDAFSAFWRKLLYVEKDWGMNQGAKLPKLRQFHQKYLHDVKKIKAQYHLAQEVSGLLKSPRTAVYKWAENFATMIYKNALDHDVFLAQKMIDLSQDIQVSTKKGEDHLLAHLHISFPNETAWNQATYDTLLDALTVKFGMARQTATHFLGDIARQLLQCNQAPDPELSEALDALLNTALNHLGSFAAHKEKKAYWNDICCGLMMLGANPLTWMDARMAASRFIKEEDSHGFFVACQQSTLFLSVITHRSRYLGETSLHLKEKFDELVRAIEAFGQRLYACVSDDASWWWELMSRFGFANQGGARLERAGLFWAAVRWVYISINEQLNQCETAEWSAQSMYTLQSYASLSKRYTLKVPRADFRYNQGFATWQRLDTAFKDYCDAIVCLASLRRQKAVAIELDVKTLEIKAAQALLLSERQQRAEAESRLSRLETKQRTSLERHLILSLDKMLKEAGANSVWSEKLTTLIEEVIEIHETSLEMAQASLMDVITRDERYASLSDLICRRDRRPMQEDPSDAHVRLSMFQPAVVSQPDAVSHSNVA